MGNDATVVADLSIIATWTKDDFLVRDTACEWLYQFKDEAYLFTKYRSAVADRARQLRVSGFSKMLQDYMKTHDIKDPNKPAWYEGNVTEFLGQPIDLNCGKYVCNDEGISVKSPYGESNIKVCDYPIMPIRVLTDIDTEERQIEIAYRDQFGWKTIIRDNLQLSKAKDIVELSAYGIPVTSESAKEMVKYISYMLTNNNDKIPCERTVSKLGWTSSGFSPYVDGLRFSGSNQYQDIFCGVTEHGNYDKWLSVIRELRTSGIIPARIVLAAAFASPMISLVGGLPFFVHLWSAKAGIGKTVLQKVSASVWGNPEKLLRTFNATDVALEHLASFCNNLPLYLDELQTIQGRKGFDDIIYKLCEGQGKSRGSKYGGTQRILTWCNVTVSTGEQPITSANSKAGAMNRVLEIEIHDKAFSSNVDSVNVVKQNYGFAGKKFVQAIEGNEELIVQFKEKQREYYEKLVEKATDKQSVSASILLAADWMAEKLIFKDGIVLKPEDIINYLTTESQANTNARAYDFIVEWVAANARRFDDPDNGELYGEIDPNNGLAYIISSKFRKALSDEGYSPASFLSMADTSGYILTGKSRVEVSKRIRGFTNPIHCICLVLPKDEEDSVS